MYNSILFTFMKLYCFVPNSNPYKCFISYLVELNTSITLSCFIFIVGRSTASGPAQVRAANASGEVRDMSLSSSVSSGILNSQLYLDFVLEYVALLENLIPK